MSRRRIAEFGKKFEGVYYGCSGYALYEDKQLGKFRQPGLRVVTVNTEPAAQWEYYAKSRGVVFTVLPESFSVEYYKGEGDLLAVAEYAHNEKRLVGEHVMLFLQHGKVPK